MADSIDLGYAISLAPAEVVDYFTSKGYTIGFNWHDVQARAHARAFTVAGILKQDILQDIRKGLQTSLADGRTLKQFKDELIPLLQKKGWIGTGLKADADGVLEGKKLLPRRLDTIFHTNMQAAYAAGRYQQQLASAEEYPYWQYVAVMDSATRPAHSSLHGLTLPFDDPAWDSIYPPNGFGCRCMVRALSAEDVRGRDIPVSGAEMQEVQQPWGKDELRTVQAVKLPGGKTFIPDAGFGHNPGKGYLPALGQRLLDRAAIAPPQLAAEAVKHTLSDPAVLDAVSRNTGEFVRRVLNQGVSRGELHHVGAIPPEVVRWLSRHKGEPQSAVISLTDKGLIHATRDEKVRPLPDGFWEKLPEYIHQPQAILYDKSKDNLLWVLALEKDKGKVAVHVDYKTKVRTADNKGKERITTNYVLTGSEAETINLKHEDKYQILFGSLESGG